MRDREWNTSALISSIGVIEISSVSALARFWFQSCDKRAQPPWQALRVSIYFAEFPPDLLDCKAPIGRRGLVPKRSHRGTERAVPHIAN